MPHCVPLSVTTHDLLDLFGRLLTEASNLAMPEHLHLCFGGPLVVTGLVFVLTPPVVGPIQAGDKKDLSRVLYLLDCREDNLPSLLQLSVQHLQDHVPAQHGHPAAPVSDSPA
jgi:hypothetical protein